MEPGMSQGDQDAEQRPASPSAGTAATLPICVISLAPPPQTLAGESVRQLEYRWVKKTAQCPPTSNGAEVWTPYCMSEAMENSTVRSEVGTPRETEKILVAALKKQKGGNN